MKGRIVLIPVDKPVEGMKIVWKYKDTFYIANLVKEVDGLWVFEFNHGQANAGNARILSELQQIAIEYEHTIDPLATRPQIVLRTLPLLSTDWEYAIKHIGEEVEWDTAYPINIDGKIHYTRANSGGGLKCYASIILPSPVMYTEEDVENFLRFVCEYEDPFELVDGEPEVLKKYIKSYSETHKNI